MLKEEEPEPIRNKLDVNWNEVEEELNSEDDSDKVDGMIWTKLCAGAWLELILSGYIACFYTTSAEVF